MDPTAGKATPGDCVRVAVNIRPLITTELLNGCTDCITVIPGEPQVQIGSHAFTFDHVYGSSASPSSGIYDECVAPLIDAIFRGYNATVLAYGQTGSGKTYTMGTNYAGDEKSDGIIPRVMGHIFKKIESAKENIEFLIRVSFIEIFKEEVFDLLDSYHVACRGDGAGRAVPSRVPIQIRETANGGIMLAGVTEADVCSEHEMASFLARGSLCRATASTNMNNQSSRSHAIFTISMEMKSKDSTSGSVTEENGDDILCAKLHLVDLAGSERVKRTGADGIRLKEGIHINKGLLALGNVISALGDEKKRKDGVHVPYRDSKLTRLLQDSLGGNSKTVMIACVSPADTNAEETINTLKYANRARNIQNKAIINRDPAAAQMQKMKCQLEQLQAELLYIRGAGGSHEELQVLQHKITLLEARNVELSQELSSRQLACECLEKRALDAQLEKEKLVLKLESLKIGRPWNEIDNVENTQDFDLLKTYVSRVQDLEMKLLQIESMSNSQRNNFMDCLDLEDDSLPCKSDLLPCLQDNSTCCENEDNEKEMEYSTLQDKFGKELQELNKQLQQKEAEMKQISKSDPSVLKQHYEKKLLEMEQEKKALQKEIEDLQAMLANLSLVSDDGAQKLKQEYLKKLNVLEAQVSELKKKQEAQSQVLRQKQRSEEAAKRLQEEIQRIKTQKVQLQHKIKQESEQFRLWKASREKEVLQLKKEGRRNEYEMHKLLALNQRQKMVLQRKTEEASLATKRLKELLEAKKTTRESSGPGNANGPGMKALIQTIEHELEVTVRVHDVRSQYERQLEARSAMANELSRLKDEELLKQKNMGGSHTLSPSARNSRIIALENMLATSSSTLVTMASQLSEAEERERVFSGRGRWNQIRSLPDAKSLMNFLFELESSSRCRLRDMEIAGREKDAVIKEMKEKILALNVMIKQLEAKQAASICSDKPRVPRKSTLFVNYYPSLDEDMDLSESEQSDKDLSDAESDEEWVASRKPMQRKRSRLASQTEKSSAEPVKLEILDEEAPPLEEATHLEKVCCSCSKKTLCKTKKCECRAANGFCNQSCGCLPTVCKNREGGTDDTSPSESMEKSDSERTASLAHQGAILLQSALGDKPAVTNNEDNKQGHGRKPLSDIGNKPNSTAAKPGKRKNWRKSVIQIVPTVQPSPNRSLEDGINGTDSTREIVPLKLPRAMAATVPKDNHPLVERHSVNPNNQVGRIRLSQDSDEKENG